MAEENEDYESKSIKFANPKRLFEAGYHSRHLLCFRRIKLRMHERNEISSVKIKLLKSSVYPVLQGNIGSSKDSKIYLKEKSICPNHARINWDQKFDRFFLKDNDSKAGTSILGAGCREHKRLYEGDEFTLGARDLVRTSNSPNEKDERIVFRVNTIRQGRGETRRRSTTIGRLTGTEEEAHIYDIDEPENTTQEKAPQPSETVSSFKSKASLKDLFLAAKSSPCSSSYVDITEVSVEEKTEETAPKVCIGPVTTEGREGKLKLNLFGGISVLEKFPRNSVSHEETVAKVLTEVFSEKEFKSGPQVLPECLPNNFQPSIEKMKSIHKISGKHDEATNSGIAKQSSLSDHIESYMELEIISGPKSEKGKKFTVREGNATIGSHSSNSIVVEGKDVAQLHALLEKDSDMNFCIRDVSISPAVGIEIKINDIKDTLILPGDIFTFGTDVTVQVGKVMDDNKLRETWTSIALRIDKIRKSQRYEDMIPYIPRYILIDKSSVDITLGRKVPECDVSLKDYDMPPFAAMISSELDRYHICSVSNSNKKGLFRLLGRRGQFDPNLISHDEYEEKPVSHEVKVGDIFKFGRTQLIISAVKVESRKDCIKKQTTLLKLLQDVPLFSTLHKNELAAISSASCKLNFKPGETIVEQGELGKGLYIITKGEVLVYHAYNRKNILAKLKAGQYFGETALIPGYNTQASCRASEQLTDDSVTCYFIDYHTFDGFLSKSTLSLLERTVRRNQLKNCIHELKDVLPFSALSEAKLKAVVSKMEFKEFYSGEKLFTAGERMGKIMYLLLGAVQLYSPEDEEEGSILKAGRIILNSRGDPIAQQTGIATVKSKVLVISNEIYSQIETEEDTSLVETLEIQDRHHMSMIRTQKFNKKRNYSQSVEMQSKMAPSEMDSSEHKLGGASIDRSASAASRRMSLQTLKLNFRSMQVHPHESTRTQSTQSFRIRRRGSMGITQNNVRNIDEEEGNAFSVSAKKSEEGNKFSVSAKEGNAFSVSAKKSEEGNKFSVSAKESETNKQNERTGGTVDIFAIRSQNSDTKTIDDTPTEAETVEDSISDTETLSCYSDNYDERDPEMSGEKISSVNTSIAPTYFEKMAESFSLEALEGLMKHLPYYLVIKVLYGNNRKRMFVIETPLTIFGRDSAATSKYKSDSARRRISINDNMLSRDHSLFEYRNGKFYLTDMGSKNGSFVYMQNDVEHKLENGDIFQCSNHTFTVLAKTKVDNVGYQACSLL